jgi:glycosyltransferase involved in cell wall biosynthesis
MKKVHYIISDIDKALAFEWIALNLNQKEVELTFVLLNKKNTELGRFLNLHNKSVKRIYLHNRFGLFITWFNLFWYLIRKRPDVIHTHMRYAAILGITAGFVAGIKARINTRHHSTSNHLYYPHAVKHDRLINRLCTHIVAISDVVRDTLVEQERLSPKKIVKIPHGFDLHSFQKVKPEEVFSLRNKYIPNVKGPVIGMISRYMELKGHLYVIEAFSDLLLKHPNAHLILANTVGPYSKQIKSKLSSLPACSYTEIQFEPNIFALYKLMDIFVHVPINKYVEAFGQTYIEALASCVPSVFTLSGIANEFIIDRENALVVNYQDSKSIENAIEELILNEILRHDLIAAGKVSVMNYNLSDFMAKLSNLYNNV